MASEETDEGGIPLHWDWPVDRDGKRISPALALIQDIRKYCGHQHGRGNWRQGRSRDLLRGALHAALKLAIVSHVEFGPDDFVPIWHMIDGSDWEGYYALACNGRPRLNRSAAIAYEHWRRRPPFLFKSAKARAGERMYVGYGFWWPDAQEGRIALKVTSFAKDGQSLTACAYQPQPEPTRCEVCGRSRLISSRSTIGRRSRASWKMRGQPLRIMGSSTSERMSR